MRRGANYPPDTQQIQVLQYFTLNLHDIKTLLLVKYVVTSNYQF